ncbi:hypothetical protein [Psychrobacillus antarcticus]|uniref:hypothetical protein n=1 Tax=Psychrobacillus antarcticus TaxID=2879115 RepID=UPI002407A08E|nr:hypothetical protein [Psychrobacillus antarcticus]
MKTLQSLFEEKFEIKNKYSREELCFIVDFFRGEIGSLALDLYHSKIGRISRSDVVLGKISFNPRHILKALYIEGIITKDNFEDFIELDDGRLFNLLFTNIKDYKEELIKLTDDVENLMKILELVK